MHKTWSILKHICIFCCVTLGISDMCMYVGWEVKMQNFVPVLEKCVQNKVSSNYNNLSFLKQTVLFLFLSFIYLFIHSFSD